MAPVVTSLTGPWQWEQVGVSVNFHSTAALAAAWEQVARPPDEGSNLSELVGSTTDGRMETDPKSDSDSIFNIF
jgi:hypothetical protein